MKRIFPALLALLLVLSFTGLRKPNDRKLVLLICRK